LPYLIKKTHYFSLDADITIENIVKIGVIVIAILE